MSFQSFTLFLVVAALLACTSCGGAGSEAAEAVGDAIPAEALAPSNAELPADFLPFYERFHRDSAFQMAHIAWPLAGNLKGDTAGTLTDVRYEPGMWTLHRPVEEAGAGYERAFEVVGDGLVFERIRERSGAFAIERRWAEVGGEWNLIYYRSAVTVGG